jgi:hypothetical protein
MIVNNFNSNQVAVPNLVGLHPELLSVNVLNSDGMNVGLNPVQTVSPVTREVTSGMPALPGSIPTPTPSSTRRLSSGQ